MEYVKSAKKTLRTIYMKKEKTDPARGKTYDIPNNGGENMLGDIVRVIVDRPLGSYHPEHRDIYYPLNYGYIEGILAPDGEEQDAYIIGVDEAVSEFTGKVIAVIHRFDDVEEKWVVAPENMSFSKAEIQSQVQFQEQYFKSEIRM